MAKTYTNYEDFLSDWQNPEFQFEISTSGSTGKPKMFFLERDKLELSVLNTSINIKSIDKLKALCCLPTAKMGGFMQLVRAAIWGAKIFVIEPSLNPMTMLSSSHDFETISISPMQLSAIQGDPESWLKLLKFKVILIGGAALNNSIIEKIKKVGHQGFYGTYGMTETYSHIALCNIPEPCYTLFSNVSYSISNKGVLKVKSKLTNMEWLVTKDVVEEISAGKINILGRIDNVINSGGVKFQVEDIESLVKEFVKDEFYVSSRHHENLGQEIVLVVPMGAEVELVELNIKVAANLGRHAVIRAVLYKDITHNSITGKIERKNWI